MLLRKDNIQVRKLDSFNYVVEKLGVYRENTKNAGKEYPCQTFYYARLEDALVCFVDQLTINSFDTSKEYSKFLKEFKGIRSSIMKDIKEFVGTLQKSLDLPEDK